MFCETFHVRSELNYYLHLPLVVRSAWINLSSFINFYQEMIFSAYQR